MSDFKSCNCSCKSETLFYTILSDEFPNTISYIKVSIITFETSSYKLYCITKKSLKMYFVSEISLLKNSQNM